jgi:hypothetical protein
LPQGGCAWENLPPEGVKKDFRVSIILRVQGSIDPNLFYFIVFNFSGLAAQRPEPQFEDEKRGLYWDAYYLYGNPRNTGHDFYRAIAGTTKGGQNKLDLRPLRSKDMVEFVPAESWPPRYEMPSGNEIRLELDFGAPLDELIDPPPTSINLNMMVASLPFDRVDNPDDEWDALIYDSFNWQGLGAVTIHLTGGKTDFSEYDTQYKAEEIENIGENPPANANIVFWRLHIL